MYIKEITIDNFRIYKGAHQLSFSPEKDKNIFILSGSNGYGKTTFLTALVWCLYGKQMKDVDDYYKAQISEVGGYGNYIQSSQNHKANANGENEFEVSITFSDIDVPTLRCDEIKIVRTGFYKRGIDDLKIYIDGNINELTKEVGNEIFVQDFILPKEVAKFFFFDAEKIVALAENKSIANKRHLSKAYSEVLGIKKYEDLKSSLKNLTLRFRQNSASPADKAKFDTLKTELEQLENNLIECEIQLDKFHNEREIQAKRSEELQEKLIREGSDLSVDEINNLKIDKHQITKEIEDLKLQFRDLLDLAPFAISGRLVGEVKQQIETEQAIYNNEHNESLHNKAAKILSDFKKLSKKIEHEAITNEVKKIYLKTVNELLDKHLNDSTSDSENEKFKPIHSFSGEERNAFLSVLQQLQTSYQTRVRSIAKDLREKRTQYARISRKLSDAESKETDGLIAKIRTEKTEIDDNNKHIDQQIALLNQNMGGLHTTIAVKKATSEGIAKKIKINERYVEKDKLAQKLIDELDTFIKRMKLEKKTRLEKRILDSMNTLMHKQDFVNQVVVEVGDGIIDILLYNSAGEEIEKNTLSKGEQQLYASSILKALVDESNIDFPVFIDSPLQKFDAMHSKNIIADFYPNISKQVVLFPLLEKEMTQEEYALLVDRVKAAYLISNDATRSAFIPVSPKDLFTVAKKMNDYVL